MSKLKYEWGKWCMALGLAGIMLLSPLAGAFDPAVAKPESHWDKGKHKGADRGPDWKTKVGDKNPNWKKGHTQGVRRHGWTKKHHKKKWHKKRRYHLKYRTRHRNGKSYRQWYRVYY